ncbi:tRNA threonylcarbamoyladenosine biosynthesis protein TsaE [Thermodesulfovibrio aggregans]|uniref:tRNA threonylcarbamoyladenosine biosynthesis protein TsaE n=1 Tax=Thermodesulfovibrio aggregans TaxID=86166 RepID=A0A0U9HPT4_9BACT|nr:tRNA (adenosine(37)-N6)-threonylcarbamoyltransferase complex ATPase subunit type 1 TsaE [Thermodesulfovibrio aggregans]GAQ95063.1 tRNA threonylcarbamoyladenosine biosynthesis protein TsaE [Thermodesulfovibrio aggregans]
MKVFTYSEKETKILGKMLGSFVQKEGIKVIALYGEMGAGKTVLTKGIASAFGIDEKNIASSSFVIVSHYPEFDFCHIDLYRLDNLKDEDIDLWEYFDSCTCVIEWAERLSEIPENTLKIKIDLVTETTRVFNMEM